MRCCYLAGLGLLLARPALGQAPVDTTQAVFNTVEKWRVSSTVNSTGCCTEVLQLNGPRQLIRTFYPSGCLHEYVPLMGALSHGVASTWSPTGQLLALEPYRQGRREGEMLLYYEDGHLKRQASYQAGNELASRCYGPGGEALAYFPYEQLPLYPGGQAQLLKEVTRHLRWTPEMLRQPIIVSMWVNVSFLINEKGVLYGEKIEVPSGVPVLDRAVLQAVARLSRTWQPGRRDGQPITFRYRLPVEFKPLALHQPFGR